MAQTIEGFVGTSLDEPHMTPIRWRVFAVYQFNLLPYGPEMKRPQMFVGAFPPP